MESKQFIIDHPSQLNALSAPFKHRSSLGKIIFNDSFQHADKKKMERELNKNYYACGCSQGTKALLIGIFVFGVAGAYGFYNYDWSVTKSIASFFGGATVMSLLGKLMGLSKANNKLKQTIKEIQSVWKPVLAGDAALNTNKGEGRILQQHATGFTNQVNRLS